MLFGSGFDFDLNFKDKLVTSFQLLQDVLIRPERCDFPICWR